MKRKLRPSIRKGLTLITGLLAFLLLGVNDFSLSALPILGTVTAIIALNVKILENF
jgi:hypothetical protein